VDENLLVTRFPEDAVDPLEGGVAHGASGYRHDDVLQSEALGGRGLIERPGLHRVTEIEHDAAAGLSESLEVRDSWLSTGHYAGEKLAGVGDALESLESRGHGGLNIVALTFPFVLRLAIAQLRPHKGAYEENLCRLGALFREAGGWTEPPNLMVAPEAALTGYFLEGGVRDLAVSADQLFDNLTEQHRDAKAPPFDVALGFYEVHQNRLYNSALYARLGGADRGIRHIHRKVFLPTYGVFDEERFVEAGRSVQAFDTAWGRAAILICEDAWHSFTPMLAALDGAQLIIVPSASPARGPAPGGDFGAGRPASLSRWSRIVQDIAGEHGVYVALSQLVGFEGGKAFPGGSLVATPRGEVIAQGPIFEEALIPATLDFEEITRARADLPLLADLEMRLPHLLGSLHAARREKGRADGRMGGRTEGAEGMEGHSAEGAGAGASVTLSAAKGSKPRVRHSGGPPARPLVQFGASSVVDPLAIDPELTRRWLVEFLRDEVQRRRGFEKVVIGLSGGVDSSLVAFLAAEALGAENVIGVRMPYRTSSPESLEHAQLVISALGIEGRTVDISAAVDGLASAIGGVADPGRLGNIMARARMITVFDVSAAERGLPVGTGNKTERLLGYFTWHADDSPPVNPIGDLFKTQVWALARHMKVPEVIVSKPASADLIQGQTDEGDFGISYPRADAILHWILLGYHTADIVPLGFTEEEIGLVRSRLDSTHWKRRLPTVAMLSATAIGEYYLRPVDY
jgi:NAD+ synthase (glutamine-hydrolysing)